MAFSHEVGSTLKVGNQSLGGSKSYSGSGECNISEIVIDGSTDYLVNIAFKVSAVQSFWIQSDVAVTLETNSGGSPANTLVLKPGVPYQWTTDSYDTFKLTTDVTKFYFTNASGSTANIECRCIVDATP